MHNKIMATPVKDQVSATSTITKGVRMTIILVLTPAFLLLKTIKIT